MSPAWEDPAETQQWEQDKQPRRALAFIDVETTGLDPDVHQVWEIALALDDGPIQSTIVEHHLDGADPVALAVSRYHERGGEFFTATIFDGDGIARAILAETIEQTIYESLSFATLVGANPAFDAAMLRARWGDAPWHFRLLDVEAYAMGALGYDRPRGLATITRDLRARGFEIPVPDHSAAADVAATRAAFYALRRIYGEGVDGNG